MKDSIVHFAVLENGVLAGAEVELSELELSYVGGGIGDIVGH
jgi:hypothetical protein